MMKAILKILVAPATCWTTVTKANTIGVAPRNPTQAYNVLACQVTCRKKASDRKVPMGQAAQDQETGGQ